MRKFCFLLFILFLLRASAYDVSANTMSALSTLNAGDVDGAIAKLKKAAAMNDIYAQFYLAKCNELGIGMPKNPYQAFFSYRRTAERGFAPAMIELARCYRYGFGVVINLSRAEEWENRFEKKHDGSEIYDIAEIYESRKIFSENSAYVPDAKTTENIAPISIPSPIPTNDIASTQADAINTSTKNDTEEEIISDVDINIPISDLTNENTFALVIANENYQEVAHVPNALNDGEVFAKYCNLTLGIPSTNIHVAKNATLNNFRRELNHLKNIAKAYGNQASFIVYYAGHGFPDESSRNALLLPVDGFAEDASTCFSLNDFYSALGEISSKKMIVFLDACFSGSARNGDMIVSARGIAIKPKNAIPTGNMVVLSSTSNEETAYSYQEQNHGLFTYFLLKKIKETAGMSTLGDLIDYIKDNVTKKSILINGKMQTPTVSQSVSIDEEWRNWKLN